MPSEPPLREKMAVLMPTSRPSASTSAPPELPGLMAASVWMKFSKVLMPSWLRPNADTMPEVTVWPTLNGIADGQHHVAHLQIGGVAQCDDGQLGQCDLQHRDVGFGVGPDEGGAGLTTVAELDLDVGRTLDDMVVRQQHAVSRDDDCPNPGRAAGCCGAGVDRKESQGSRRAARVPLLPVHAAAPCWR